MPGGESATSRCVSYWIRERGSQSDDRGARGCSVKPAQLLLPSLNSQDIYSLTPYMLQTCSLLAALPRSSWIDRHLEQFRSSSHDTPARPSIVPMRREVSTYLDDTFGQSRSHGGEG